MQVDAKMEVIARSEPGFAGFADELTLLELVADFDIDGNRTLERTAVPGRPRRPHQ